MNPNRSAALPAFDPKAYATIASTIDDMLDEGMDGIPEAVIEARNRKANAKDWGILISWANANTCGAPYFYVAY
jgi:hypothetical protein